MNRRLNGRANRARAACGRSPARRCEADFCHRLLAASAAVVLGNASAGWAASYNFTGATGTNWNVAADWTLVGGSTHVVPVIGDSATLGASGTAVSANFNQSYTGAGLAALTFSASGSSSFTLIQSTSGTAMIATNEYIGTISSGNYYNQSAGTNTITADLVLSQALFNPNNNTYTLSGTGSLSAANELVGDGGIGVITQSAGTNNVSGTLSLGALSDGNGQYTLNAVSTGTGSLTAAQENIGDNNFANGNFVQDAGTNSVSGLLTVGNLGGGYYNLQGGTLTTTNANEGIGYGAGSNGTFTQSGGYNFLNFSNSTFYVGANTGAIGIYNLQNGSLNISVGSEYIGGGFTAGGTGTFTQTGGTNNIGNSSASLILGYNIGDIGVYSLQGGTLTVAGKEYVGYGGTGTFTQMNSGTNNANGGLDIATNPSANGQYDLNGGTLSVNGNETVGDGGAGSFFQGVGDEGAGTILNTVSNSLYVGYVSMGTAGAASQFVMESGTLTVGGGEFIGSGSTASFAQSGGTNNANAGLYIGGTSNYAAVYTISGGEFDGITPILNVSSLGILVNYNGTLSNSGGTVNCPLGTLDIVSAYNPVGTNYPAGSVNFSSGTMEFAGIDTEGVPSNFTWTGGILELTEGITFDSLAGGNTTSAAFGNSLTLNSGMDLAVTGNETIGGNGYFTLTLNAGSADTATGNLLVAPTGTLIQDSGPLAQSLNNQGYYYYDGGAFSGQLTNSGTALFELSFTTPSGFINSGNVSDVPLGVTLTLNGLGLNNSGSVTISGGSIIGNILNTGLIYGYGAVGGISINNSGVITQSSGNLQLTSTAVGLGNTGTINLAAGLQLNLVGANATNDGAINLDNGNLNGSLSLTNNADGVVTGPGRINLMTFLNNGLLEVPNGDTTVGSFTNNGVIEMAGAGANLGPTGAITNAATIEGFGKISQAVINNSLLQPTGGTLIVSGALTNPAAGTISVGASSKLLVTSGLATNAGLISLTGGTFDNNNDALNNTGQITGYGLIRSGGLTNNGTMYLTGGTTTVNGPVTNNTTLDLNYQPATFTGAVANYGTIKTTGMTATFTGTLTNETGSHYTSDPSTNVFQANITTNAGSQMTGGSGDQYYLSGGILNNQGNFTNAGLLQSSDLITNSGTFSQTGTLIQSANFSNSGTATIGGSQTWSAGTTFTNTAGTATFQSDAGPATATLAINATGGAVNVGSTQHLATLTLGSGATATAAVAASQYVVSTSALTISGAGQLNLTANTMDINFGAAADPATTIRGYIASGYNNDKWTGAGIVSSNAAVNPGLYAVGYADGNLDAGTPAGANQILIENTLAGDSNLDGVVNFADLLAVAQNFNHTLDTHKNPIDWVDGDFNYDGKVNFADLLLVAQNFNKHLGAGQLEELPGSFSAAWNLALADVQSADTNNVPEPASAALLVAGTGLLLRRKRSN